MNNDINPLLDELLQNAAYWNRRLRTESGMQNKTKMIVSALFNTDTKLIELSVNQTFMNDIIKEVNTWGAPSVNKFAVSHKLKEYFISKYTDLIGTEILGYLFGESGNTGNSELKLPEEVKKKIKQRLLMEPL